MFYRCGVLEISLIPCSLCFRPVSPEVVIFVCEWWVDGYLGDFNFAMNMVEIEPNYSSGISYFLGSVVVTHLMNC